MPDLLFHYECSGLDELARLFAEWAAQNSTAASVAETDGERIVREAEARAFTIAAAVIFRTKFKEPKCT